MSYKKNLILIRLTTIFILIAFLCQNAVWSEPLLEIVHPVISPKIFVPETYGRIEQSPAHNPHSDKMVILIKDAHCNYEAQTNISHILDILIRDHKIDLVCVEGASDHVNPSIVAAHCNDNETRKKVTDTYLRTGLLTASEALSINRGTEPGFVIWGVEDLRLYLKDYQAFRNTINTNGQTRHFVKLLSKVISQLKKKLYPEKLQKFDEEINRYEINEIPLTNFIKFLALTKPIKAEEYPSLNLVLGSIRLEEKIYFGKLENERSALIKHLENHLPKEDLRELIKQSLLFKLGKIPQADYYTYLEDYYMAYKNTLDSPMENLEKYFLLVKMQVQIDEKGLFRELEDFGESIYTDLLPSETARHLHKLDRDIKVLTKVLNLESTREDFIYYKNNRQRFQPEKLISFIKIQAPVNNIALPPELSEPEFLESVKTALLPSEEFYNLALDRDHMLVENLISTMEKHKKNTAVLIVGGFHTDGIRKILLEKGISTTIITPSITKPQEDAPQLYLARIMDERIDPEMILAKLGLENLSAILALSYIGYMKKLPQPIIDALKKMLPEIPEEFTPEEFREKLWPLLEKIYPEVNHSVKGLIENAVEDYNGRVSTEERLVLHKQRESLPETREWEFDLNIYGKNKFRDIEDIISDLEKFNVYWQVLEDETKELIKKRIENLENLPGFIQKKLPHVDIRAINVKGSFIWGPGIIEGIKAYHPKDIDIMVIVSGVEESSPSIHITPEERKGIFPDQTWASDKLEIKLIGTGNLSHLDTQLNRAISARFSGVTISGGTFFSEYPPVTIILEKTRDLIMAARLEDMKAVGEYNHSVSRIETILSYYEYLKTPGVSKENIDAVERAIEEELEKIRSYLLAKIRVVKRLLETNLWLLHLTRRFPELDRIFKERDSIFSITNAGKLINKLLIDGVMARDLITEDAIFQIEYAIFEAEENLDAAFQYISDKQAPSPAHMESIIIPPEYQGTILEKGEYKGVEEIKQNTTVQDLQLTEKTIAKIDEDLWKGLGFGSAEEFLAILSEALARAKEYPGTAIENLSPELFISLLTKSPHIAENHLSDGFIGINAYAIELYNKIKEQFTKKAADNFIQWLLEHELVHELTDKGKEIEDQLTQRDAQGFIELFGRNAGAILNLLDTTHEFSERVNFYNYEAITTASWGVGNRKKYEEGLVKALREGRNSVQAVSLKIQNFKGEFNNISHSVGDLALEIIGPMLQVFLNDALKDTGVTATVYNEGPSYYLIFQNIKNKSTAKEILEKLIKDESEFRRQVIAEIKRRLPLVLAPKQYSEIEGKLDEFTAKNFNIYGGISELREARSHSPETAKEIADTLDIQAIEIAKYAQLTINEKIRKKYMNILAYASRVLKEGTVEKDGPAINKAFSDLLDEVRTIPGSNIQQYESDIEELVRTSKAYVLSNEYTSFHKPITESYNPQETYETLFKEYREALEQNDFERIKRIKQRIARKVTYYLSENIKGVPIYLGNQRYKDTINYILRTKPRINLKLTFRIGGDEYGVIIWNAEAGQLRILRCDGNNIRATTSQWGREIGDKVIDEMLRIIQETEDVSKIPQEVLNFFSNMGDRGLALSDELYERLYKQLENFYRQWKDVLEEEFDKDKYFKRVEGKYILIKIPPVVVEFPVRKGKEEISLKFLSPPMVSIGEANIYLERIPEFQLGRDYSVYQGIADRAAESAKKQLKIHQAENNGKINPSLAYETVGESELFIPSFKPHIMSQAQEEMAEFIVGEAEARAVTGEISGILKQSGIQDIEEREIAEAIIAGREGRERVNIMELLKLAKNKGLMPERVFAIAVKIGVPLDKLLDTEARKKGAQVLEAILERIIEGIDREEEVTVKEAFLNTIRKALEGLGITTEEIESDIELIEMGLHIIAFDPLLDITEIDASYFDFIKQLSLLAGVKEKTITKAFSEVYFTKQIELLTAGLNGETRRKILSGIIAGELELRDEAQKELFRKIPSEYYKRIQTIAKRNGDYFQGAARVECPESELSLAAARLKEYDMPAESKYDLSKLERLCNLFFRKAYVIDTGNNDRNRYISGEYAAGKIIEKLLNSLRNTPAKPIVESLQPVGVVRHINDFIVLHKENDGTITFSHRPGVESIFRQMEEGINIIFTTEGIPEDDLQYYQQALKATERYGKNVFMASGLKEAQGLLNIDKERIVYISRNSQGAEEAKKLGLKSIVAPTDSPFYATIVFAVLYARAGPVLDKSNKLNPEVETLIRHFLELMDYKEDEITEVIEELKTNGFYFTVKYIRIKDTLKEFQNRRITIEVAV